MAILNRKWIAIFGHSANVFVVIQFADISSTTKQKCNILTSLWICNSFLSGFLFSRSLMRSFKIFQIIRIRFLVCCDSKLAEIGISETNWLQLFYWCNKIGCVCMYVCFNVKHVQLPHNEHIETTMCNNTSDKNNLDFFYFSSWFSIHVV